MAVWDPTERPERALARGTVVSVVATVTLERRGGSTLLTRTDDSSHPCLHNGD
jgi:hypothetical protein